MVFPPILNRRRVTLERRLKLMGIGAIPGPFGGGMNAPVIECGPIFSMEHTTRLQPLGGGPVPQEQGNSSRPPCFTEGFFNANGNPEWERT